MRIVLFLGMIALIAFAESGDDVCDVQVGSANCKSFGTATYGISDEQACARLVMDDEPEANGMVFQSSSGGCWAAFGMDSRDDLQDYTSCFLTGN